MPNHTQKNIFTAPFHICLLYEGEYEDPYDQFAHSFDDEILCRFPSFLHWLIVWWYKKKHVPKMIPLLEGPRGDQEIKVAQRKELIRLLGEDYKIYIFDYYTEQSIEEKLKSFPSKSNVIVLPMYTATKGIHEKQQHEIHQALLQHKCQVIRLQPLHIEHPDFLEVFAECIRAFLITSKLQVSHFVFVAPRQDRSWFSAQKDYRDCYEKQAQNICLNLHKNTTYHLVIVGDKKNPHLPDPTKYIFVPLAWWCGSKEYSNYCISLSPAPMVPHIGMSQRLLHHIMTMVKQGIVDENKKIRSLD